MRKGGNSFLMRVVNDDHSAQGMACGVLTVQRYMTLKM